MAQPVDSPDISGNLSDHEYEIIEDSSLHPGVASAWAVGRKILADGDVEEALSYLNYAYRTLPDVVLIAMDYQDALAQGGFVRDAVKVMDKLVGDYPDSLQWRIRRSALNLRLGESGKALGDLKVLRKENQSSAQLLETEALIMASKGDNKEALALYRSGLSDYPEQATELYMGMIQIYQHSADPSGILKICTEAIAALPLEPVFREMELRSHVSLGQSEEALKAARAADKVFLTTGLVEDSFILQLADIHVQGGQIDRAIEILTVEEETNGLGLNASLWMARLLLGSNRIALMEGMVEKIEQKWPDAPRLWFLKGKLAEQENTWDIAVQHYEKAVAYGTNDPEILLALVRGILVTNDTELALVDHASRSPELMDTLEKYTLNAASVAPEADSEGQLVLGYAFRSLLDYEAAIAHLRLAAQGKGFRKTAMTQASICYDEMGNTEKSLEILQGLYLDFPEDPEVANSLGYFLAEKNMEIKKAEKLVSFALAREPSRGAYLDSMGWVLYRKGNLDDAFDYLIRAVNAMPDDPVVLEHLGTVLYEQNQLEQALDVLRRALQSGGNPERLSALIRQIENQVSTSGN